YMDDKYEALEGADALVIMTEWDEFAQVDFDRVRSLLKEPIVIDGRNMFDPRRMAEKGFVYHGIGRN
ncbi:MAG: UDP binding domain-containing protein, partial [Acidobacteriota bacterium]